MHATSKKRILVPIDFSDCSIEALRYAMRLAEPLRARLIVLHVVEVILHYAAAVDILLEEQLDATRRRLSQLLEELRLGNARAIVQVGIPYRVIVETAGRLDAELIVMGTHGRSGVSRFLAGSVAERVVRMAKCPVLTVSGRKPEVRAGRARRRAPRR
jgi:nucleotide-binding universal stress UspA family protein